MSKIVYLDADFKCHTTNDGTMISAESDFFDGKCDEYIESYRFVPAGMSWTRDDGEVFQGEMISPWRDYSEFEEAQILHEEKLLGEYTESLRVMGVVL